MGVGVSVPDHHVHAAHYCVHRLVKVAYARLFGAGVAMEAMDACNVATASGGEDFR